VLGITQGAVLAHADTVTVTRAHDHERGGTRTSNTQQKGAEQ